MFKKRFPFYHQHDANDCGPTCLRMIAAHYGKRYSLEYICERSSFIRTGISLLGISETAERLGFKAIGAKIDFSKLEEAPLPCIVYWNQNHFVVVYKIDKKKGIVYIANPAQELVKLSKEEFCNCWMNMDSDNGRGAVLLLEPTASFYEKEVPQGEKGNFLSLIHYLCQYKKLIFQLVLGLSFGSLLQLALPFLTQATVDIGIKNQNLNFIYVILLAQLMLTISGASLEFVRGWILLHIGTRVNIALISDFLTKLMKLPIGYFDSKMTGDLLQRIGDHDRIQLFLTSSSLKILFSIFNILIFGIVLCLYSVNIFLLFLAGSLIYYLWIQLFMRKRAEIDHRTFSQQAAHQSNIVQLITGMQEIRLNNCERRKLWEWQNIQAKLFNLRIKSLAIGQYQESGAILINQVKNILITFIVAKSVITGDMTLGMMLSVQYIIGQMNGPIDQLITFFKQTQDAKLSFERLCEIRSKEDEETTDFNKLQELPVGYDITFKDVCFAYNRTSVGQNVLEHINFTIPAKKQTAIVGMSGSGKTTLIKLLLGYYPVKEGGIYLGDKELESYSWKAWRRRCGVVTQDGFIFSDTIARNIAPSVDEIDKVRLENAVTIANIKEFIESRPLSYNTKIGSEGDGLSQGQKQRILIARAIYKNPEFVFFDEATNALDANNEKKIMNNLNTFFEGRTVLIIAHRLSTVRYADQIIVLDQGRIVEIGNHDELIGKQGAYYKLVKNQLEL